jgi:Abnormal spindle-like microcephaly-assoc'd, ASPM-SPD-2-Hydin/PQQ-like domain
MHVRGYLNLPISPARRLCAAIAGLALALAFVPALTGALPGSGVVPARADELTASQDAMRTGWDPHEPGLTPAIVHGGKFTQLFRTTVSGQVYAQPVVVNGVVIVATENDWVYGLDPVTGASKWPPVQLGQPYVVAKATSAGVRACANLTPNLGVTGTPAFDPVTGDVYMFAATMVGTTPHMTLFGLNPATGQIAMQQPISGSATNAPSETFNPAMQLERPGVLIQDGAAYGAFASFCDTKPYVGYVARVALPGGSVSLWSDESGAITDQAGIWQSGGGIMSDGPGSIFVASGNGVSPAAGPGTSPPGHLAESVIHLSVDSGTGAMTARDFFSPANAPKLDAADTDYGSGGPIGLPFGTSANPHMLVQAGKDGRIFVLNRDSLGGREQGANKTDKVLAVTKQYRGEWNHPAAFANTPTLTFANQSNSRDYLYYQGQFDSLRVFRFKLTPTGKPALFDVANTALSFGYTSGAPVVTSSGTNATTAVLWEVYVKRTTGLGGTLEAYNVSSTAVGKCKSTAPCTLNPIWHASIGTAAKYSIPATSGGRVYVGTRDGHVYGFGVPGAAAVATAPPATFAQTSVNSSSTGQATVTADKTVTLNQVTTSTDGSNSQTTTNQFTPGQLTVTKAGSSTAVPVTLPVTLHTGDKLHAAVTFSPSTPGTVAGTLSFATTSTSTPSVDVPLTGSGTQAGLVAGPSANIPFPWQPDNQITPVPVGIAIPLVATLTNYGTTTETVASVTPPSAPFSATGLPAVGTQIQPGQSISVQVIYAPTSATTDSGSFTVTDTDSTSVTVHLSGVGAAPITDITTPTTTLNFGKVKVGKTRTVGLPLSNDGNQPSTITTTTPLAAPFHTVYQIQKGMPFNPEADLTQRVAFTPTKKGTFTTPYTFTWTDPTGTHTLTVTLTGKAV